MSGQSAYQILAERGIVHIPEDIEKKLTVQRWFSDFSTTIGLSDMPVLENFYKEKLAELTSDEPLPDRRWEKTTAILGLLHSRFYILDLPFPESWTEGKPYCRKEYSLSDVNGLPISRSEISRLDDLYSNPNKAYFENKSNPWELRKNLAGEFVDLFLGKIKQLAESVNAKSPIADIIERNGKLRELLSECQFYNSVALTNGFYEKLPDFCKKFDGSKDPALRFTLSMLQQRFVDYGTATEWELISKLFGVYFDSLEGKDKKIVEVLKAEVLGYLNDLLKEVKRLQRKLDHYEAE